MSLALALPDCPNFMKCSITHERMDDPVQADDDEWYDRNAIQDWFAQGNTISPVTDGAISQHLVPNQRLKTQIQEWVDDQVQEKAAMQKLDVLQAPIFRVSTSEEAASIVTQISELVNASTFVLLNSSGVETIRQLFGLKHVLTDEVSALLVVLDKQCQDTIQLKQEKYDELHSKCDQLETLNTALYNKQTDLHAILVSTDDKIAAAEKIVAALEIQLLVQKKCIDDHTTVHTNAKKKLGQYNENGLKMNVLINEYGNEREVIEHYLVRVNGVNGVVRNDSTSSVSSSSS